MVATRRRHAMRYANAVLSCSTSKRISHGTGERFAGGNSFDLRRSARARPGNEYERKTSKNIRRSILCPPVFRPAFRSVNVRPVQPDVRKRRRHFCVLIAGAVFFLALIKFRVLRVYICINITGMRAYLFLIVCYVKQQF